MFDLPLVVAFVAGLVSFASPCVLPLIPGYIAYLAGASVSEATTKRLTIFVNSLCFVAGFSLVFALLGVLLNTVLEAVAYDASEWVSRIGGVIIILFGLYLMGIVKIPWLQQEHRLQVRRTFHSRYATSFVFGAAFAAGWTPCVGAVLGSILGLAASQPGSAFTLLMAYAVGFSLPFLIVGLFTAPAAHLISRYAGWARTINSIFGVLLVGIGTLIFTQTLSRFANVDFLLMWLQR